MNATPQRRTVWVCAFTTFIFTLLSTRLVYVQVNQHDSYVDKATANQGERQRLPARRGVITDRRGEALAQNVPVQTLVLDATVVKNPQLLSELLASSLNLPQAPILERLTRVRPSADPQKKELSRYIVLKKNLGAHLVEEIKSRLTEAKALRGVSFEVEGNRLYPNNEMLCHVVGFVNNESKGVDGVEMTMDSFLSGHDGSRDIVRTRRGETIEVKSSSDHPPLAGHNVSLTIDMGLQNIVEQELDAAIKELRPKGATVVMLDPKTGEILALANRPNFNLNVQEGVKEINRMNLAVSAQVEPGSTFKIVTVAAVLDQSLYNPDSMIYCENGYFQWCNLKDHHAYADLSVNDILVHSSNIGIAKLARSLGDQKFFDYIHRFGFGVQTGVSLPGEIRGVIHPPHTWSKISITRMPIGQEVAATPIQIVSAMATVANGGTLMIPQIVREITDESGTVITTFPPRQVRQAVSKKVADQVRLALIEVASKKGTAKNAQVPGFVVAGKTGTAQKLEKGLYSHDKHVCSFVGFMPANDPAFVMLVLIDEARTTKPDLDVGGLVAAPVFSRIAARAAKYLDLTPSYENTQTGIIAKQGKSGGRNPHP